jgi:hypothetical protein
MRGDPVLSRCACGCGTSLEDKRSNARYASAACRTRAYKERHGIVGYRAIKSSLNGTQSKPSGRQVSARKMERVLVTKHGMPLFRAHEAVQEALPAAQRSKEAA